MSAGVCVEVDGTREVVISKTRYAELRFKATLAPWYEGATPWTPPTIDTVAWRDASLDPSNSYTQPARPSVLKC